MPSARCSFAISTTASSSTFHRCRGSGLAVLTPGRGAAFGDLFNNGKIDVVINPVDGPPVLLRNVNPDHHHWVELKLVGGHKSPRDAVGATVYLTANGIRQREDVMSGGSYISSNDQRPHFGLGEATDAGTAEIHWPDRRPGDSEAARRRPHLHRHRRPGHHRHLLRIAVLQNPACRENAARRNA